MAEVRCTVDSCEFWGQGQVCKADKIWVRNDISGDVKDFSNHFINASQVEFGKELDQPKEEKSQKQPNSGDAKTSPQTCCDTMRPKREGSCDCCCE